MNIIDLPGDLSEGLSELRDSLVAKLGATDQLVLNAEAVWRVSTTGLQVLLNARRQAEQQGVVMRWEAVSSALADAAASTGLTLALALPDVSAPPPNAS